jgi:hypothetical protein
MKRVDSDLLRAFGLNEENLELYNKTWVSEIKYFGPHVGTCKIQNPKTGYLSLVIVLDNETKKNHLYEVLDNIFSERDIIKQPQDTDLDDFLDYLLQLRNDNQYCFPDESIEILEGFSISKLNYRNANMRELMWDINFDALVYILRASKLETDRSIIARHFFNKLLLSMNYGTMTDINDLYEASVLELQDGRCPWDINDGPVYKDKVENKLEQLIIKYGNLPRKTNSRENRLRIYGHFHKWSDWNTAISLIEKSYPKTFKKYKARFDARTYEIMTQQRLESQYNFHDWSEEQEKPPD